MLDNIKQRLTVAEKSIYPPNNDDSIEKWLRNSKQEITKAMQPYGYFSPTVRLRLTRDRNVWQAHYDIRPGQAVRISYIDIQISGPGKHNPKLLDTLHRQELKVGDIFTTEKYEKTKKSLFHAAETQGYIKAKFTQHTVNIRVTRHSARIIVNLDTGPQYYFGIVSFTPSPLSLKLLSRFIPFKQGEPYSVDKVLTLQNNLSDSGYFQSVKIDPEMKKIHHRRIPILVELHTQKALGYSIGIGYGTDTGPRASLSADWRRVNAYGHRFNLNALAAPKQSSLMARYTIPGKNPINDQFNITASGNKLDDASGKSTTGQFGVSWVKIRGYFQKTFAIDYLREKSEATDNPTINSSLLIPSITLTYRRADNYAFPSKGIRVSLTGKAAHRELISDVTFSQAELNSKAIVSVTPSTRIIAKAILGATDIAAINSLPLTQQFYTGGAQSVRGYEYRSLGPGRYLVLGSIELQQKIMGSWYIAGFYDAGNAFNKTSQGLKRSVGAAIVRKTAIGPIHIGVAKRLDTAQRGRQAYRFVFSMGPDL